MTCYREGGCGPYEGRSCTECPASKPECITNIPIVQELKNILRWENTLDIALYGIVIDGRLIKEAIKQLENKSKQGKWIEDDDGDGRHCSECGTDYCYVICDAENYNFCPNCAAKCDVEGINSD